MTSFKFFIDIFLVVKAFGFGCHYTVSTLACRRDSNFDRSVQTTTSLIGVCSVSASYIRIEIVMIDDNSVHHTRCICLRWFRSSLVEISAWRVVLNFEISNALTLVSRWVGWWLWFLRSVWCGLRGREGAQRLYFFRLSGRVWRRGGQDKKTPMTKPFLLYPPLAIGR